MENGRRRKEHLWIAAALLLSALVFFLVVRSGTKTAPERREEAVSVRLSEIMAANDRFPDGEGALYDWIEVENPSSQPAELAGWGLSDREDETLFVFPEGTVLPAGGQLLVYCDKMALRPDMAPFGISSRGDESVFLFRPDGMTAEEVPLPALSEGQSCALGPDGLWAVCDAPTPGLPNAGSFGPSPVREENGVVFAELMSANRVTLPDADGDFSDWVELWNRGEEPRDLTGWYLSDDRTEPKQWQLPALTLGAGERRVVFCSGKDRIGGELHTNFSLDKDGGVVTLADPEGSIAESVSYQAMEKDQVAFLSLVDHWEYSFEPSPGFPPTQRGREAFLAESDHPGAVVIQEAASYNDGRLADRYGGVYDWVELKNTSDGEISLGGWRLTTDLRLPDQYVLPETTLAPGAALVVLCAGEEELRKDPVFLYAPFRLGAQGERLFLLAPDGTLSDRVLIRDLPYGGSIGRLADGAGFYLFDEPTPGTENAAGFRYKAAAVETDVAQGVYDDVESLTVALMGEGEIHYTLNGSVPTARSPVYSRPLKLTKTTVIRAVSMGPGLCRGDVCTFSYIINENHTLPVASLVCDPVEFENVFMAFSRSDECEGEFALFDAGATEFTHGCTVRLHGNTSRHERVQKPLMIEFNDRFGGDLLYDVFSTGEIERYSSLLLRGETVRYVYILRDSVAAAVAEQVSDTALALDNRYCVLYVNGEYFGIYPIREDYSRQYVASHTGSTLASCRVVKGPVKTYTAPDLCQLLMEVTTRNMRDEANYQWAAERLDMPAFADWLLLQGYFNNHDVGGNIRYLYGDNTGGKWRPAFYDLDLSMAGREPGFQVALYGGDQVNGVLFSLMQSPLFRALVQERAVLLLQNGLAGDLTLRTINEYAALLEPEIPREVQRWEGSEDIWRRELSAIRLYFGKGRTSLYIDKVAQILDMSREEKMAVFGAFL